MLRRLFIALAALAMDAAPAHAVQDCLADVAAIAYAEPPLTGVRLHDAPQAEPGELSLHQQLGEGNFAVVWTGVWTPPGSTPRPVIVKRLKRTHDDKTVDLQLELEVRAYRALGREVTVLRTGAFVQLVITNPRPGIRTETLEAMALPGPKKLADLADDSPKRQLTLQKLTDASLDAVIDLELHGVNHGDLKPANLLVETTADGFRVEAIDYGVSRVNGQSNHYEGLIAGTPVYLGLEAFNGQAAFTARRHADSMAITIKALYLGAPKAIEGTANLPADPNATGSFAGSTPDRKNLSQATAATGPKAAAWGRAEGATAPSVVRRHSPGGEFEVPSRVVDDRPQTIPPQLALVLDGRVAASAKELKALIALSRKPEAEFLKDYASHWQKAFKESDPLQREILVYGLLSSRKYSAAVFGQMTDAEVKSTLRSTAFTWKSWATDPNRQAVPPAVAFLGRHPAMAHELDLFLEDPIVVAFRPPR